MTETTPTNSPKSKRKRIILILLSILLLCAVGGWFGLKSFTQRQLNQRLANLDIGKATIGNVSVALDGVGISNLALKRAGETTPWLQAEQIAVKHPLWELASAKKYQTANIQAPTIRLNVDDLLATDSNLEFDLGTLELPFENIEIDNAELVLFQSGRSDLILSDIDLNLTKTESGDFKLTGSAPDFLNSNWDIGGEIVGDNEDRTAKLTATAKRAQLTNGEWQSWPLMPDRMQEYLEANATADINLVVNSRKENAFDYRADIDIETANLNLPGFELPIDVRQGLIEIKDGKAQFKDVIASTDKRDQFKVKGNSTLDGFPFTTKFESDFTEVDIDTVRKLVAEIPLVLSGNANGTANGSVAISNDLSTELRLSIDAESTNGIFGKISADKANVDIEIQPLVLTSEFATRELDGKITILGEAVDQDIADIFATFELQDLSRQLDLAANGSGTMKLEIPLASAERIETWNMDVTARAPNASFSRQLVEQVDFRGGLKSGDFVIQELTARPTPLSENQSTETVPPALRMEMQWPITDLPDRVKTGSIQARGVRVPPKWLIGVAQRQLELNQLQSKPADESLEQLLNEIAGNLAFETRLEIPTETPDDVFTWRADVSATDAVIKTELHEFTGGTLDAGLADGQFTIRNLSGAFTSGGSVSGFGQIDLKTGNNNSGTLDAKQIPVGWLAELVQSFSPAIQSGLKSAGIELGKSETDLSGQLDAKVDLKSTNEKLRPWIADLEVRSQKIQVKDETLLNLFAKGTADAQQVIIEQGRTSFRDGGDAVVTGNYQLQSQQLDGKLNWNRLSLGWLAGMAGGPEQTINGHSQGELTITTRSDTPEEPKWLSRLELNGKVAANDFGLAGIRTKGLSFEVRTDEQKLLVENFKAEDNLKDLAINAELDLTNENAFSVNGNLKNVYLNRVFKQPSVTERIGSTLPVSGIADAKFAINGDLQTLHWNSVGDLHVENPRFNNEPLSRLSAEWQHDGNDIAKSSIDVSVFDGKIKVFGLRPEEERVRVAITDLDSRQISSLLDLPEEVKGRITGDALIEHWGDADKLTADLEISGKNVEVGPTSFGELNGDIKFNEGKLSYNIGGRLYDGKIESKGETPIDFSNLAETELPVKVRLENASLFGLVSRVASSGSVVGSLSGDAELTLSAKKPISGSAKIVVGHLKFNNDHITREVTAVGTLTDGVIAFNQIRADLLGGVIQGRVIMPTSTNVSGRYEFDLRRINLQRLAELGLRDTMGAHGKLNARFSGRISNTITGRGTVDVNNAGGFGLTDQSFKVPMQFEFNPNTQQGRVEMRRTQMQLFDGKVFGSAALDIGRQLNLKSEFRFANLDTGKMFESASIGNQAQGKLSGRMVLQGRGIQKPSHLSGSFVGHLDRAQAFDLPILSDLASFLGSTQLDASDFASDEIDIRLSNNRIEVRRMNFASSLAQVAITGGAYLDGRLDLKVAGRISRLNEPLWLDEISGSPLARFTGPQVAFFAQAAEFLSNRLVFVQVGGTASRPALRLDTGQQLREEAIRYFLRGSQILPTANLRNN